MKGYALWERVDGEREAKGKKEKEGKKEKKVEDG